MSGSSPLAALRGRAGVALLAVGGLVIVAAVAVGVLRSTTGFLGGPSGECTVEVDGQVVELSRDQAENASTIVSIAVARGLPARAASIALATAYQESDLHNLDHGDRDSLGLFQQRPSQGWGTPEELQDPVYASNAFYDALVDVDSYESLEITVAAQEVQRSAFPGAYADHEDDARALASALTGNSPGALSCDLVGSAPGGDSELTDVGLTPRAQAVRDDLAARFGDLPFGGFAPGGVESGHIEGSAHYEGRAVDVFFRPVSTANRVRGWAVAQYLVANAARLDVRTVIFDDRVWQAGRPGWLDYDAPDGPGDRAILEHRDHVHVDVFE